MRNFGVFRGLNFKGSVIVECIKCREKKELQALKHVDIIEISNQVDLLCDIEFVYTDRGVYCKSCHKELVGEYANTTKKYCPIALRRGVNRKIQEGAVEEKQ